MESQENDIQPITEPEMVLTGEAKTYLLRAGKWANFLAIIGFIVCGLLLIIAFAFGDAVIVDLKKLNDDIPGQKALELVGVIVMAVVCFILVELATFFISLYLFQFGDRIKKGVTFTNTTYVTSGFSKLRSFFKFAGLSIIIAVGLFIAAIIVANIVNS